MKNGISFLLCMLLVSFSSLGSHTTAVKNGNWSSPSTWSAGVMPSEADTTIIPEGIIVDVDCNLTYTEGFALLVKGTLNLVGNHHLVLHYSSHLILSPLGLIKGEAANASLYIGTTIVYRPDIYYYPYLDGPVACTLNGCNEKVIRMGVQLNSFQASFERADRVVLLQWETLSETNSHSFTVERSKNGRDFSVVGSVSAAGSAQIRNKYAFKDQAPVSGTSYYRLKQTDLDGRATIFKMVQVYNPMVALEVQSMTSGENGGGYRVSVNPSLPVSFALYNHRGRLIEEQMHSPETEVLEVLLPNNLAPGVYFVRIQQGEQLVQKKVYLME